MRIVKFCDRSHNPLWSDTRIQLCSLYYYRSIDNEFLCDIDEGMTSRTLHPPTPVVVTGDELGRLTGLSIGGNGTIKISGRAVRTTNPIPNAYVFCTSSADNPTSADASLLGYDACYVIKDPAQFSGLMADELHKQITPQGKILSFHGPVSYQDEKGLDYSTLPEFVRSHGDVDVTHYFLKRRTSLQNSRRCYADEREYRFVFIPVDNGTRPLPLNLEKVYLASTRFLEKALLDAV